MSMRVATRDGKRNRKRHTAETRPPDSIEIEPGNWRPIPSLDSLPMPSYQIQNKSTLNSFMVTFCLEWAGSSISWGMAWYIGRKKADLAYHMTPWFFNEFFQLPKTLDKKERFRRKRDGINQFQKFWSESKAWDSVIVALEQELAVQEVMSV